MSRIDDIKKEVVDGETLGFIARAYTEVSAAKMQSIRSRFDKNHKFYDEIRKLYIGLKQVALKRGLPNLIDRVTRVERILAISVTSNHRFVGELNSNVVKNFWDDRESYTHHLVVGRVGIRQMETLSIGTPVDTMEFEKDSPNAGELTKLLDYASDYDRVYVYHPEFRSLRTQAVSVRDVTYSPDEGSDKASFDYILEPELPAMLSFFETQVRRVLFERTMLETELSWTAARLWEMSSAEERADEYVHKKRADLLRTVRSLRDLRLGESIVGILYEE